MFFLGWDEEQQRKYYICEQLKRENNLKTVFNPKTVEVPFQVLSWFFFSINLLAHHRVWISRRYMLKVRCLARDLWQIQMSRHIWRKHRALQSWILLCSFILGAQWSHWKIASVLRTRLLMMRLYSSSSTGIKMELREEGDRTSLQAPPWTERERASTPHVFLCSCRGCSGVLTLHFDLAASPAEKILIV